jgi:hypothetical protein
VRPDDFLEARQPGLRDVGFGRPFDQHHRAATRQKADCTADLAGGPARAGPRRPR